MRFRLVFFWLWDHSARNQWSLYNLVAAFEEACFLSQSSGVYRVLALPSHDLQQLKKCRGIIFDPLSVSALNVFLADVIRERFVPYGRCFFSCAKLSEKSKQAFESTLKFTIDILLQALNMQKIYYWFEQQFSYLSGNCLKHQKTIWFDMQQ